VAKRWIDSKVDLMQQVVDELGMVADRAALETVLRERVEAVAAQIGISSTSARRYFNDETVKEMARSMVVAFAEERPGADLSDAERDVMLPLRTAGLAGFALAEALRIRLANESPENAVVSARYHATALSLHGLYLTEAGASSFVPVTFAWLLRAARYIEQAAVILDDGGVLADESPIDPAHIADRLREDATKLRSAAENGRNAR